MDMKANELRLGNYVSTPNQKEFRIDEIEYVTLMATNVGKFAQYSDPKLHPLTWYFIDLSPIPLTEEWLLKLGFDVSGDYGCVWAYKDINEQVELRLDITAHNGFLVTIYYKINDTKGIELTTIQYVHQLQNLYYALTGEELCLK